MAFGAPPLSVALIYLGIAVVGALGTFNFDSLWIRIPSGALGLFGILCLLITNAWTAFIWKN